MAPDLRDPRAQKFILAGIFLLALVYAYYALAYRPQADRVASLGARLARIERHVERARRRVERHDIEALKGELASLEDQLRNLERLLPRAEEVPDLLEMIERKGIRSGIQSILFEPAGSREGELYREQVYKVSVRGGYHRIATFLARVGSSPRIVKTSRMNLASQKRGGDREEFAVVASFEISTYILPGEGNGQAGSEIEKNG